MRKQVFILIASSVLLASCANYSAERKQVSALIQQVEADQERLEKLNPKSLPMRSADITSRLDKISNEYDKRGEFFDLELGNLLADFKVFTKIFRGLNQKRLKLKEELELSRKQLQDLDRDLKERALTADKARKYLDDEQLAVKSTTANLDQLDTLMARGARGYLRMVPKIDSIIATLDMPPSE